MKKHLAFLSLIAALAAPAAAQDLPIGWMFAWGTIGGFPNHVERGEGPLTATLPRSGWTCSVGAITRNATSGSRFAVCKKGQEEFEFGATCDKRRPFTRSQVRFKDASGKAVEYVSVECDTSDKPFTE